MADDYPEFEFGAPGTARPPSGDASALGDYPEFEFGPPPSVVARPTEAPTARITVRPQGAPEPPDEVGMVEDTLKGGVGGLARGTAGLFGTTGSIGELMAAGAAKAGVPEALAAGAKQLGIEGVPGRLRAAGIPQGVIDFGTRAISPFGLFGAGPSGAGIQRAVEPYTGKFYEPKYKPGQYLSTLGEFAPAAALPIGGMGARVLNTVVPAIASETAGQFTKGQPIEPWARGAAALLSAPLAAKAVTPFRAATPARQQNVAILEKAGIPLSAGERTGFKPLGWAESVAEDMPFSSTAAVARREASQTAQDRYITSQMFDPAEIATRVEPGAALPRADVMAAGAKSLGDKYDALSAANALRSDPQLHTDFSAAVNKYASNVLPSQRAKGAGDIGAIWNDIANKFIAGQGRIAGSEYQLIRSRLGRQARAAYQSDPELTTAFKDMRGALDRAMERGLSSQDAAAWRLNNQRWAVMKTLEPAIAKAQSGEHMSPAAVATALRAGPRRSQYVKASGVMDRYAQAAADVFKPLPQSGTAPRAAYQSLLGIPTQMAGGAGVGAAILGLPGAIAGAAIPFLPHAALRGVVSGPGQRYLGNRVLPQNLRDILAQTLLQQTIAQPSIGRRNEAELAAGRRAREERTRALGLR